MSPWVYVIHINPNRPYRSGPRGLHIINSEATGPGKARASHATSDGAGSWNPTNHHGKPEDPVDVKRFLDDVVSLLSDYQQDQVNGVLTKHALRKDEPVFRIHQECGLWILSLDDAFHLWIKIFETRYDAIDLCREYELRLIFDGEEYKH